MRVLGVTGPRSLTFNSLAAVRDRANEVGFPALVKPDQGGSGARIFRADSLEDVERLLEQRDDIWFPDNLLLLQEYVPYDEATGIIRMEFLGGKLLYAMRVVSHGAFNLCPSPACNPEDGSAGVCEIPEPTTDEAGRVLPVSRGPVRSRGHRPSTDPRGTDRRRRNRVSRRAGRPARLLRHQREFQPSTKYRGHVWIRSVRARRRTILKSRFVHPDTDPSSAVGGSTAFVSAGDPGSSSST